MNIFNLLSKGHCVYIEDICENLNECVFYVSPHLIDDKEQPTEDTEVVIEYRCMPGKYKAYLFLISKMLYFVYDSINYKCTSFETFKPPVWVIVIYSSGR